MPALIEGFSEVFGILKELASAVKAASQIPENKRKEMRDEIADTAELIDQTLAILKQHLTSVISELRFGDRQHAKRMIYELGDFPGWVEKYRKFQMCESLHLSVEKLDEKGLFQLLSNISYQKPDIIKQRMSDYIGGEINAARSVSRMLESLTPLADSVDSELEMVVKKLEEARNEIGKWRQAFIDLELEIRSSI